MPTELLLSNAALEMVSFLIVGIAAALGMVKLLSVRHAGLFAVVYAGVPALVNAFGYGILSGEVGFILLLLSYIALPVALSEGGLALRIVVAVAALICVTATEAVEWALWGVVLAGPVPEGFEQYFDTVRRNVPVWMVVQLVRAAIVLLLLRALRAAVRRCGSWGSAEAWPFVVLAASQLGLFLLAAIPGCLVDLDAWWYGAVVVLALACVAVDAIVLVLLGHQERALVEGRRAALLQKRLDEQRACYAATMDELEKIACIRHDARNQLQTIEELTERGEFGRARMLAADLRAACESGEGEARR